MVTGSLDDESGRADCLRCAIERDAAREEITLAPVEVLAAFLVRDMRLNAVRSAEVREIAS
jgi:hypothetical protein